MTKIADCSTGVELTEGCHWSRHWRRAPSSILYQIFVPLHPISTALLLATQRRRSEAEDCISATHPSDNSEHPSGLLYAILRDIDSPS